MSKEMSDRELAAHCQEAGDALADVLGVFSRSPVPEIRKRSILIAYWVKTCARYWKTEDAFAPQSVFRLKRGSVVRVEFGYRVRKELGGRHYAAVLDASNALRRDTVTVIPLSSKRPGRGSDPYTVDLEDGFYAQVLEKAKAQIELAEAVAAAGDSVSFKEAEQQVRKAKDLVDELSRLKSGSVAKADQIVTVSKMRISAPLTKDHPLYGVRLTDRDMDRIDDRLRRLFFPSSGSS